MLEHAKRLAAVATVLRDADEGPEVLLIKRAERQGDPWSGQMAFPGGRHETSDPDLLHTATRETREEIGLDLREHGELLGRLDDTPTHRSGLVVRPFVFAATGEPPPFTPNYEVAEVLWAPLLPLARGEVDTKFRYEHEGKAMHFPAFDVRGRIVWGLTYRMLRVLFHTLPK